MIGCLMDYSLYPFLPNTKFAEASVVATEALKDVRPFKVTLRRFNHFKQGKGVATVWLDPQCQVRRSQNASRLCRSSSRQGDEMIQLQRRLQNAFPICDDLSKRGGFHPHLTVGQCQSVRNERSLRT